MRQKADPEQECVEYFRQNTVWEKVLKGFREKYFSYGRFGGSLVLENLSGEEIEELEGFFGKSFRRQNNITISAEKFKRALKSSRYGNVKPELLLETYFGSPLLGKKEEKSAKEEIRQNMLEQISRDYYGSWAYPEIAWFFQMLRGNSREDFEKLEADVRLLANIWNRLPYRREEKIYLPIFAAMLTGNPHAFDQESAGGKILYKVIQRNLETRGFAIEETEIFSAYKKQKSFFAAGILLDDVSNYAVLYNIEAIKKDGRLHKGVEGFCEEGDIIQVPLGVIADWKEVRCRQNEIYIVENPAVFAMLCNKENSAENRAIPKKTYMCMNGQPRLSGLLILDLLAESKTQIHYSGDLDPEGILIAQKLASYYKGEFSYWHMEPEDYEKSQSEETISERRIKILDKITDSRLIPVALQIKKHGKAGYQEKIFSCNSLS